jgi:hypothetical protein
LFQKADALFTDVENMVYFVKKVYICRIVTLIKKENKIFLINKEIQMASVAKSYMRKGFLIYEERRKYLTIYEEAVSHL